ncbi:Extracellular signal-regulated kinase 2 (ERK2) (Defective in aggregation protein C) (MAP kinase 2) [Durusdinium trenchii]|uniref:Mitogen-activated protein kinase n=1 Tax=Durusdinium trenchii TaxID=1381693 RepID=A0ABP0SIW3_9DINO
MGEGKSGDLPDQSVLKRFEVLKLLGKGAYGIVWKVKEKDSGRTFALKRCFDAFQNSTDAQRTFREIIFLQELNGHENIVRLMNVMKADSSQDLYVIFDYMESDLQKAIVGNLLQPIHVEYITYQVLKALKYIHSAGVLHRDLKPANVLLNSNCHARICDFGLARTALPQLLPTRRDSRSSEGEAPPLLTDYVATRWYRAPELLLGSTVYAEGVDMWSVGCILGEMVAGKPILRGRSAMDQLQKVVELTGKPSEQDLRPIVTTSQYARSMLESLGNVRQMPSSGVLFLLKLPQLAKTLTLNLLKFNPEKRPSAELALQDVFLEKFFLQEAEPLCDKVIRMPIADMTKLKASDYRDQIYTMIAQRRKMAQEEAAVLARRGRHSLRRQSSRYSEASTSSVRDPAPLFWNHEGGAAAPPSTPK